MRLLFFSIFLLLNFSYSQGARLQDRFALLIGNKNYKLTNLNLKNPHNDIETLATALKTVGFKITIIKDADYAKILKETKRHASRLQQAGENAIGFFYYSGHGALDQKNKRNYIIPIDVSDIITTDLWNNSIDLNDIIRELKTGAGKSTHFVVFDACRNELQLLTPGTKSGTQKPKGFRAIQATPRMLVAYATAEGKTASDVGKETGPYASVLSNEIIKPGIEAVKVFRNVQLKVSATTGQEPWVMHSSFPEVFFAERELPDEKEWTEIKNDPDINAFIQFINKYPESKFSDSAKFRIEMLQEDQRNQAAGRDWKKVEASRDIPALSFFIKKYPKHPYTEWAKARIKALQEEEKRNKPIHAWNKIKNSENTNVLKLFIQKYPKSIYADVAKDRILNIVQKKEEKDKNNKIASFWEEVKNSKDLAALQKFIKKFPDSEYSDRAASLLAGLKLKNVITSNQETSPITEISKNKPLTLMELTKNLQRELKRVGCNPGQIDGVWGAFGREAIMSFNQYSNMQLDHVSPTIAAIEKIRSIKGRVCPRLRRVSHKPTQEKVIIANRPNATSYSKTIWPYGSLTTGEKQTTQTKLGKLTCIGGSNRNNIPRRCHWH